MTETSHALVAPQAVPHLPPRNPAVLRCCQARELYLQNVQAKDRESYNTSCGAAKAYRKSMPDLAGYENIRDFIACAAHGMLIGALDANEAPRYLYAAQVALGALRHEPKDQKRPVTPTPP